MEWNKLISNPMLLEGMANLGKGIVGGSPDSAATWLGDFAISRIKANNYAKMLQGLLTGTLEGGGNLKMGGGKMTLDIPTNLTTEAPTGPDSPAPGVNTTPAPQQQGGSALGGLNENAIGALVQMMMGGGGSGGLGPYSSSPSINAADLAGLTPEEIGSAVQLQQGQKALQLQEFRDLANTALGAEGVKIDKEQLSINAQKAYNDFWAAQDLSSQVQLPDGTVTTMSNLKKNYPPDYVLYTIEYNDAASRGAEKEMPPFRVWQRYKDPTTIEKELYFLSQDPQIYGEAIKWKQAGAPKTEVNIGQTKEKAAAQSEGSALGKDVGRLKSSDYMEKLGEDLTKDQQFQMDFSAVMGDKAKETQVTLDAIERKLEQESGAKIVKRERKGNVAIWTVELEDGTRVERRYTIK